MGLDSPTISEICSAGADNLTKLGIDCRYTGGKIGPSIKANHLYLDSLFFHTRLLDPVDADITVELFGRKLKTPVFCSAISRRSNMPEDSLAEIGRKALKDPAINFNPVAAAHEDVEHILQRAF